MNHFAVYSVYCIMSKMLGLVYWYFKWVFYNCVFSSRCVIVFGGLSYGCHCCTFSKGELVIQSEKYPFVKTFAFVSSVSDTLGGLF